tara:strand:+ start:18746 stop:19852 length:1107 start_codon:yes stop_codon:yes gene_type:complete
MSNPAPPPEGNAVFAIDSAETPPQEQVIEPPVFPVVLDACRQDVVLPGIDPGAQIRPEVAQILPESGAFASGAGESVHTVPSAPWPTIDPSDEPTERMPARNRTPERTRQEIGPSVRASSPPLTTTDADSTARRPEIPDMKQDAPVRSAVSKPVERPIPAAGEVQRIELAVESTRTLMTDARVLLAPQKEVSTTGTQIDSTSGHTGRTVGQGTQPGGGNAASLLASMTTLASGTGGVARIRLNPPLLGDVTVQLTVHADGIECSIRAKRAAGAESIVREIASLRAGLESKGLVVDRLAVSGPQGAIDVPTEAEKHSDAGSRDDEEEQGKQRRRDPGRRSEHQDEQWLFQDMLAVDAGDDPSIEGENES